MGSLLLDEEELHMNERAIIAIMLMLNEFAEPRSDWPQHEADNITFSRHALEEILSYVWDHPWTPASDTIEQFAIKMESFKATSVTDDQRRIFSIAAETACELLKEIQTIEK